MGHTGKALGPNSTDWRQAQVWNISIESTLGDVVMNYQPRLHVCYTGDAARILHADGTVIDDSFYNGRRCLEARLLDGVSALYILEILPLSKGAPVYLPSWPQFPQGSDTMLSVDNVSIFGRLRTQVFMPVTSDRTVTLLSHSSTG